MPTLKRKPMCRRSTLIECEATKRWLDHGRWFSFMSPGDERQLPLSEDEQLAAWRHWRDTLIAETTQRQGPGYRPWGFWQFEAKRRAGESDPEALLRLKLWQDDDERDAITQLCKDPMRYWCETCSNPKDREQMAALLATERSSPFRKLSDDDLHDRYYAYRSIGQGREAHRFRAAGMAMIADEHLVRGLQYGWWLDAEIDLAWDQAIEAGVPVGRLGLKHDYREEEE